MDMIEDLGEKGSDVVIRQRVVDVLALSSAADEPCAGELLEALRHR
jgi:hypothetical protein